MRVYISGHRGMVGSAIWRNLEQASEYEIIGRTSKDLDLKNQQAVFDFLSSEKPDVIIDAAARVGGILANNDYPYPFLMENMLIQNNLIDSAVQLKIKNFIFLGSSCIYPKMAPQPLKEEHLLTGPLEPTNQWYAIAKITGVKATEAVRKQYGYNYVSLMPTNLYGPNDNFDLETSHVLPAMLRKFHDAKAMEERTGVSEPVVLWGSGTPKREFLHVDDLAEAIRFALENKLPENLYNVGFGADLSIKALAETIQEITDHKGGIIWDSTKPDGTPRKWMDSSRLRSLGWEPKIDLEEGVKKTYSWFLDNQDEFKEVKLS
jgi:GDP-L-fucose synthase